MNQTAYRMVLQCFQHAVHWEMSVTELLNLDSTPCPTALSIGEFLVKHIICVVSNFLNLTRFGPVQFLPVSQADEHLDAEEISSHHRDTTEEYNMVAVGNPKQGCDICIEKWKDYWNQCVQSNGSYFDNSD